MIVRRLRNQALLRFICALLALAILSTIAAAVPAMAAGPGIYSLGGPFNSRGERNGILTKLSRDGSLAFDGLGSLNFATPEEPYHAFDPERLDLPPDLLSFGVYDVSADGSRFLGVYQGRATGGGLSRQGAIRSLQPGDVTFVDAPVNPDSALSPNARYAVGTTGSFQIPSALFTEPWKWSEDTGTASLEIPEGLDGALVSAVTNDGTAYGQGLRIDVPSNSIPQFVPEVAVRWNPDGTTDRLAGVDQGNAWSLNSLFRVSDDGAHRLGWGRVQRGVDAAGNPLMTRVQAVFGDDGVSWLVWDPERDALDDGFSVLGFDPQISSDGLVVAGNRGRGFGTDATVWTPEDGAQSLVIYLQLAGLDTTGLRSPLMIDMSADGKTFLFRGALEGSDEYLFMAVIPEPSTGLFVGLGLMALSRGRRSEAIRLVSRG